MNIFFTIAGIIIIIHFILYTSEAVQLKETTKTLTFLNKNQLMAFKIKEITEFPAYNVLALEMFKEDIFQLTSINNYIYTGIENIKITGYENFIFEWFGVSQKSNTLYLQILKKGKVKWKI